MKKLLLAVIAVFVIGLSVIFSGCAKQPSGPMGFLSAKVYNWKRMKQTNHHEYIKYAKICTNKVMGNFDKFDLYARAHYTRLQRYNIFTNCKMIVIKRPAPAPAKRPTKLSHASSSNGNGQAQAPSSKGDLW